MSGPLEGIRVLDLSRILAGPWASQNLADLGAEVIKVERPGVGDDTRQFGPPFIKSAETGEDLDAAYYFSANRGKKSVEIDLTTAGGQELVRKLAARSDVLFENYKVGGLKKYGLDYESLAKVNPNLVYCSVTGFGQTGPYAHRAGYDFLIQGMGGLMSVTGERDDLPGGGPQRAGVALADILSGMYATVAVLAALRARDAGAGGQHIDISLLDVQVGVLANQGMNFLATGVAPKRMGNGHPNIFPYQAFPASDGHIILAVGNDEQFARFCKVAGRPELAEDARFKTISARVANRPVLLPILEDITRTRSIDTWVRELESVHVPCGPINTIDRVFADPHVQARGMQLKLPHPLYGEVPSIASPMRFSKNKLEYRDGPPSLGQHTDEVLAGLGLSNADITRLRDEKTIGDSHGK
jgi:crotonobetainyl-CoA:carnitine CoA-transferase CaiB-like acyl-CoA transferase